MLLPGLVCHRCDREVCCVTWHGKGDYLASVSRGEGRKAVMIHQLSKASTQCPFRKTKASGRSPLFGVWWVRARVNLLSTSRSDLFAVELQVWGDLSFQRKDNLEMLSTCSTQRPLRSASPGVSESRILCCVLRLYLNAFVSSLPT